MKPTAKLVLTTAALCFVVILPFAARIALDESVHHDAAPSRDKVGQLLSLGRFALAHDMLQQLPRDDLSRHERTTLSYQQALCERALGQREKAYHRLERLRGARPRLEDYRRLWMARALDEMDEESAASTAYGDLLISSHSPAVADSARMYLASLCERQADHHRAIDLYRQQLEASPSPPAAVLYQLARAYDALPDRDAALRTRLELLEARPGHRLALDALRQVGGPKSPRMVFARALVYYEHASYRRAVRGFKEFLSAYASDSRASDARYMLGRAYQRSGQLARARRTFEKAHSQDGRPAALYRIGGIQVRSGRDGEAIDTYLRFARLYPHHDLADDALWQAAKAAERHSDFGRAQELYRQLAQTYSGREYGDEARWSVGFMDYCREEYAAALQTFDEVSRAAREPHIVDQSLFWAGKSAGQLQLADQAGLFFHRAARGFPRSYYSSRAVSLGYGADPGAAGSFVALEPNQRAARAGARRKADAAVVQGLDYLRRAVDLGELGMVGLARVELSLAEQLNLGSLDALRVIRDQYEAAGILDGALRLSTRIFAAANDADEIWHLYPSYYWDQVEAAAREARVDPYLVLSVIRQESYFDEDAVSRAGAVGLMQIMPQTGRTLARKLGMRSFDRRVLFDPQMSIRMGTQFLGDQVRSFMSGPTRPLGYELGLAAYNAGPRVARQWVERFPYEDPDAFVERIPYRETRLYVKKVLKNLTIYRTLSEA